MALVDGQVQIGGLVMGPGTGYRVTRFVPWNRQTRVDASASRTGDHGSWSGAEFLDESPVPLTVRVYGKDGADLQLALLTLAAAMEPSSQDVELRWALGGVEYLMYVRPRGLDPSDVRRIGVGAATVTCGLAALDPRVYSGEEITAAAGLPSTVGGLTWPLTVNPQNTNPYFETDASNWSALGGTVARSTAQAHQGVASLLLTPDGVTTTVEARSEGVSGLTLGQQWRSSAWVRCAVARFVNIAIVWRDASNAFLSSTVGTGQSVAAGTWTYLEVLGTVPASAAFAQLSVTMGSTPPNTHLLHIDEAILGPALTGLTFPAVWDAQVSSGVVRVFNSGLAPTRPRLVISGPVTDPRVTRIDTQETLAWDLDLTAGQWLDVDTDRRTSLINGQASRSGQMTSREWFELPPGSSEIAFNAGIYNAGAQLSVMYRSAW